MKKFYFLIFILLLTSCQSSKSPDSKTSGIEIGDPGKKMRVDSPFYLVASKGKENDLLQVKLTIHDKKSSNKTNNQIIVIEGKLEGFKEKIFAYWEIKKGKFPREFKFSLRQNKELKSKGPFLKIYWFFVDNNQLIKYGEKKINLIREGKFLEKIRV